MNPRIPADYHETARWLEAFCRAHAKREDERIEVALDHAAEDEGRAYGVRLLLDGRLTPPAGEPAIRLDFREVAEGRPRLAWCEALADRIRARARDLVATVVSAR
jgi:hypothetical protein